MGLFEKLFDPLGARVGSQEFAHEPLVTRERERNTRAG
jgi:hypothetical protein